MRPLQVFILASTESLDASDYVKDIDGIMKIMDTSRVFKELEVSFLSNEREQEIIINTYNRFVKQINKTI